MTQDKYGFTNFRNMNHHTSILILISFLIVNWLLLSSFQEYEEGIKTTSIISTSSEQLKKEVFEILDNKCNVCHRKKNPFMVFNPKNMVKRAPKIYRMVFIEQRMPKGDEIKLTHEEYTKLEKWLFTQEIF